MIRLPADSPERIIKQMSTYNKSQTTRTLEIFHKCLCVSEEKPNKHVRTLNCKQHLSICHLKICLPGLNFTVSSEFPINQSESNKKCSEPNLSFTSNWVSITAWCPHNKILSVIQTTLVTMTLCADRFEASAIPLPLRQPTCIWPSSVTSRWRVWTLPGLGGEFELAVWHFPSRVDALYLF